jgi:methyl-accepting chemotaxis protein
MAQVSRVDDVVAEITMASEQQSQGIAQINTAVEQVNQVTQANAANSEEAASAAQEMSSQAVELQGLVETFHLSQTTDPTPAIHEPPPRRDVSAEAQSTTQEPWEEACGAAVVAHSLR